MKNKLIEWVISEVDEDSQGYEFCVCPLYPLSSQGCPLSMEERHDYAGKRWYSRSRPGRRSCYKAVEQWMNSDEE